VYVPSVCTVCSACMMVCVCVRGEAGKVQHRLRSIIESFGIQLFRLRVRVRDFSSKSFEG